MNVQEKPAQNQLEIARLLRSASLFRGFDDHEITTIGALSQRSRLHCDEHLFRTGEPCRAFFYLISGAIKLYRIGQTGREKTIAFVKPGETFAEAAMFSGTGYPVDAVALENSELISVDCFRFSRHLQTEPRLTWKMLTTLSVRLHELVDQIDTLSTHTADQKVAAFILEHYSEDGLQRPLPGNRSHFANLLGIKTETLCRSIGRFRDDGLIESDGADIRILDAAGLEAVIHKSRPATEN
ncbi:MAG: Crp/Fnr family transcriptional regulator [Chromatiales bacterium]|nr:Crp/Fnr family transcriptional regulator [Chromatiales bacterium]